MPNILKKDLKQITGAVFLHTDYDEYMLIKEMCFRPT